MKNYLLLLRDRFVWLIITSEIPYGMKITP